jgi:hypothetical protein
MKTLNKVTVTPTLILRVEYVKGAEIHDWDRRYGCGVAGECDGATYYSVEGSDLSELGRRLEADPDVANYGDPIRAIWIDATPDSVPLIERLDEAGIEPICTIATGDCYPASIPVELLVEWGEWN